MMPAAAINAACSAMIKPKFISHSTLLVEPVANAAIIDACASKRVFCSSTSHSTVCLNYSSVGRALAANNGLRSFNYGLTDLAQSTHYVLHKRTRPDCSRALACLSGILKIVVIRFSTYAHEGTRTWPTLTITRLSGAMVPA